MIPLIFIAIVIFGLLSACAAIGVSAGWVCTLFTGLPRQFNVDAWLGVAGVLVGWIGTLVVPWHGTAHYPHPERVAGVCTLLFPVMYELLRRGHGDRGAGDPGL